jgi:hypothetical protein
MPRPLPRLPVGWFDQFTEVALLFVADMVVFMMVLRLLFWGAGVAWPVGVIW